MSKITGSDPESISDMISDEELMASIESSINPEAQLISMEDFDGVPDGESGDGLIELEEGEGLPVVDSLKMGDQTINQPRVVDVEVVENSKFSDKSEQ